jgi:hypothetical protein
MKTFWCGVVIAAMAALVGAAQGPAGSTDQDKAAVRQAAYDYAEGFLEGSADRMERAVHPDIIKRGLVPVARGGSMLTPMNAETLVERSRSNAARPVPVEKRAITFELLDIRADIASARIFTSQFDDYLHLVKQGDRWRIAHVLWQPPAPAGVANGEADRNAVAQVVKDLCDAMNTYDASRAEKAMHAEGVLRLFRVMPPPGRAFLMENNRDTFSESVRARRTPPLPSPAVTVLHTFDAIASALVTTDGGPMMYLHLARQNDQWRVVNMLLR